MCRLIEIRSALDPRFSSFESQKALLLVKKNIFRPPPPYVLSVYCFPSFHRHSQRAGTDRHFPDTSVIESRLRIDCYVYGNQGFILTISKILEQYHNKILE